MTQRSSCLRPQWIFLIPLLMLFLTAFSQMAHAERKAAIVVGNGEYEFAPLSNPKNDSKLIAATLTELGFDVRAVKPDGGCGKAKAVDKTDERLFRSSTGMPVVSDAGPEARS